MLHRVGILVLFALCGAGCQKSASPSDPAGPPPSLTLANFEKIRAGMTLEEVEAILGTPGSRITVDVTRPDGSRVKEVQSAAWFWFRASVGPDGQQREEETRRIVVQVKDGRVTSTEQVGLK
jgi:hypothetical protein